MKIPRSLPHGTALLHNPRLNKGTAFSEAERDALDLVGLLPEGVDTEENRLKRVVYQLGRKSTDIGRYIFLSSLYDNDTTLFYKLVMSDPAYFLPLVYTPTVGEACRNYGHILRRPRGLYLGINRRGQIRRILDNWDEQDVRFIVVTDGERILGLGDLGANGMGIPVGKLNLYTVCAGVPPHLTLPIVLDVGTNNAALLSDPLYLGLRQSRVRGAEYDAFLEEFVRAVEDAFPRCCIQFEDFANPTAIPLLARYRNQVCCFNDDIQGTAGVAVAGLLAASRITGRPMTEQRFLLLGAGSAGTGIASLLVKVLIEEGLSPEAAYERCWLYDINGLLTTERNDLMPFQRPFAHPHDRVADFAAAVEAVAPTAIIGVSATPKAFDQRVIEAMARLNERPIIFPYSNPTSHAECTAEEAYRWSDGRAIVASGSPFPPVRLGDRTLFPSQGNNVYVFPAIGLATYATEARLVTDEMFVTAARAVAAEVSETDIATGLIYPPISSIFEMSIKVAEAVARQIFATGLAQIPEPPDIAAFIAEKIWRPHYHNLI